MASDHSFDIVSKVDMQEVTNAVQQALKEISHRFDFRGSKSAIELNREKGEILVISDDDFRLKSVLDILQDKLVKRKVSLKALQYGKVESAFAGTVKQLITLQQGIHVDKAREIVKAIKNTKIRAQAEIQKDQVRVRAKKIDDLQSVIQMLKDRDFGIHMEFVNYR